MANAAVIFSGLLVGLAGFLVTPVAPEQRCVSGFCLPELYEKLENPGSVTNTTTTVHVETEIMDVLQVKKKKHISKENRRHLKILCPKQLF